jgi:molybdenum cofactor synthesis domain-containing protein
MVGGVEDRAGGEVGEFNLLEKTELRIEKIELHGGNLNDVASTVAEVLGLERDEVLVIDARDDLLTLDLLRRTIDPYRVAGRQTALLDALGRLPGLTTTPETSICSEGMLGWISLDADQARQALDRSQEMAGQIRSRIAMRAIVFSTGPEVIHNQIEDTNGPTVTRWLEEAGYSVSEGAALEDDIDLIAASLREAVEDLGFGLVVTTGGVGAEEKDCTIEALLSIDAEAATPYLCKFERGHGRHVKDGIRLGVAQLHDALIVALPGPNNEVEIGMEYLLRSLASKPKAGVEKRELAEEIAHALRMRLREKMKSGGSVGGQAAGGPVPERS